jgi:hypothetical protein
MLSSLQSIHILSQRIGLAMGCLLAGTSTVAAQAPAPELHCLMLPLEPAYRAQQSALVVEAKVLDAQSFWNTGHTRLFTRHRLRVFSLLKGQASDTTGLTLITEGGRLGLDQQLLTNTLHLAAGQQGVFFLASAPWPGLAGAGVYTPFGSEQGFIEFNPADGTAAEPFRTYPATGAAFYQEIASFTGQVRRVLQPNPTAARQPARRGTLAPIVTSFSPVSLPAGANAVLTINGDGFGTSRGSGYIEFRNADDGGATRVFARETDYVSWSNNRIQVRVPSAASGGHPAGSGTVRVNTNDQLSAESVTPVTIVYALTNVESTDGSILQRPNHIAMNTSGGITFRFGPNFTAVATAAWQRALVTWRCQSGMNWEVGTASTTNAIADDGQNVVAFDQSGELPTQVLGRTTSYYRGCYDANGEVAFWVREIDMQFNSASTFQFGPALAVTPQIDFESVTVHELGHAQQLTHLNLPGAVMHYSVARGQNTRRLNPLSDVVGARQVLRVRSFRGWGCSGSALLPAPLTGLGAQFAAGTGVVLNWTTRDECFLSSFAVERSTGRDTLSWQSVGTVALNPTLGRYQFVDAQPLSGLHYYRLRLVRPDGTLDNAAPLLTNTDGAEARIFPNPVTDDQLRLQYPASADGMVTFYVYDALGRRVFATALFVPTGLSLLSVVIPSIRPGLYVLRWQDAQGQTGAQKFVRM